MADTVTETQSGRKLTEAQKLRMERNRLKAIQLRKSKLVTHPYRKNQDNSKRCQVTDIQQPIDTGAGFMLEEPATESNKQAAKFSKMSQLDPFISEEPLSCIECEKLFHESYLYQHYGEAVCNDCRNNETYSLITKTDAKKEFLLKDCDFDSREPPLRFIVRKNPHNQRWGDMKLYLRSQVKERSLQIWESEEKIEEEKEKREETRQTTKQKKFNKKMKELRMQVRSSLYKKNTGPHCHEYGAESYNSDEDTFSKTCKTCGHTVSYEKM